MEECLKLRKQIQVLKAGQARLEFLLPYLSVSDKQERELIYDQIRLQSDEIKELIKGLEKNPIFRVTADRAREIMNDENEVNFFGPEEISHVLGSEFIPEKIPPIPFTKQELQTASDQGFVLMLVVQTDRTTHNPLTVQRLEKILEDRHGAIWVKDGTLMGVAYFPLDMASQYKILIQNLTDIKDAAFFTHQVPLLDLYPDHPEIDQSQAHWVLMRKHLLANNERLNYIEQIQQAVDYFSKRFLPLLPTERKEQYEAAIQEFEQNKVQLSRITNSQDWPEFTPDYQKDILDQIHNLKINKLLRPSFVDLIYCQALFGSLNRDVPFMNTVISTNTVSDLGYPLLLRAGTQKINRGLIVEIDDTETIVDNPIFIYK